MQQPVGGDHQVERSEILQFPRPRGRGACVRPHLERWREAAGFVEPVGHHRRGRHHQRRAVRAAVQQRGEGLHRLAQAHVVGQAGPGAPAAEPREPPEALFLVGPQLGLQRARRAGLEGQGLAELPALRPPAAVGFQIRAVEKIAQRQGGEAVEGDSLLALGPGHAAQVRKLLLESGGERDESALAERHEPG